MTEQQAEEQTSEAPEQPEAPTPTPEPEQPQNDEPEAGDDQPTEAGEEPEPERSSANAEAAKRRRQLREVEAERDSLKDKLVAMQRAEVHRIAQEMNLKNPKLLELAGVQLDDLTDENGAVDAAKVKDMVQQVAKEYDVSLARRGNYVRREGTNPQAYGSKDERLAVAMGNRAWEG